MAMITAEKRTNYSRRTERSLSSSSSSQLRQSQIGSTNFDIPSYNEIAEIVKNIGNNNNHSRPPLQHNKKKRYNCAQMAPCVTNEVRRLVGFILPNSSTEIALQQMTRLFVNATQCSNMLSVCIHCFQPILRSVDSHFRLMSFFIKPIDLFRNIYIR